MPDRLLTRSDVAKYLSVTTRTVDKFVALGYLRKIKVGSATRFNPVEVAALFH